MPTRFLSDAELARLSGYPDEIADEDLVTYFRLEPDDLGWLHQHRGEANRLGLAVQLCTLPWLGFVPDEVCSAPAPVVRRLAEQLDVEPEALAGYGGWQERTRREHLREVLGRLGWRTAGVGELKALDDFLLARALEHDSPTLLLQLACDHLRAERVVRPGVDPLMRRVAAARERAWAETYERLVPLLGPSRRAQLDGLLEAEPTLGAGRLVWLRRGATSAGAAPIKAELDKLAFLRWLGADRLDLSVLPPGRRRFLAQLGRRSRPQALARAGAPRRYPVLLATVAESASEILDEIVGLFDQALAGADRRARHNLAEQALARAEQVEDRLGLLDELLAVLVDPAVADHEVGSRLRQSIGMERLRSAVRPPGERVPRDGGHLELLEARYAHLREFTPAVLAALPLEGSPAAGSLLAAVEVLRELNRSGRRHLPDDAPDDFVPPRWRGYLDAPEQRGAVRRHYWELAVLYRLQAALRSGDVWVPGSRRFGDPAATLIPSDRWPALREDFCQLTAMPPDGERRLAQLDRELRATLDLLEPVLADGAGPARLDADGELVVAPLPAEQLAPEAQVLQRAVTDRLPSVDLASLLVEVDAWTGFTDALSHAGGSTHRPPELRRNLYAAILAQACNLGVAGMADAAGISAETLAWTTQWYLREETLRAANAALVNHHHRHPLARVWGGGTLSSSDGQRFPQRGRSLTARALSRYFVHEGITTYTHVADQHFTYGTKVIPSTVRDATYVLDEILGNPSVPVAEHATDTSGQTLATFGVFDLLGLRFSPRIRDLPSLRLYRPGPAAEFARWPRAGRLLARPIQRELILGHWDDLLRLAGSLKFGHASASLMLARLHAGARQGGLARALVEYGRLVRTIFVLRYLADVELRRRIGRQLNKGETLHALRRKLFFAHEGHVRHRHHEDQTEQALCLTLTTNAIVVWNTTYLSDAVEELRSEQGGLSEEALAHLSPALVDHVNPYGRYYFDLDRELTRTVRRPLRRPGAASVAEGRPPEWAPA